VPHLARCETEQRRGTDKLACWHWDIVDWRRLLHPENGRANKPCLEH
jgi:hypothetical protein